MPFLVGGVVRRALHLEARGKPKPPLLGEEEAFCVTEGFNCPLRLFQVRKTSPMVATVTIYHSANARPSSCMDFTLLYCLANKRKKHSRNILLSHSYD